MNQLWSCGGFTMDTQAGVKYIQVVLKFRISTSLN